MRAKLKQARIEKGFSVEEIAKKLNVSKAIYYKWEAGTRDPLLENARQVSIVLGKSIEELFFNTDFKNKD
jgi:putative transcriptional regulator